MWVNSSSGTTSLSIWTVWFVAYQTNFICKRRQNKRINSHVRHGLKFHPIRVFFVKDIFQPYTRWTVGWQHWIIPIVIDYFTILINNIPLADGIFLKRTQILIFNIFFGCYLLIDRNFRFCHKSVLENTDKRIRTVGTIRRWIGENCPLYRIDSIRVLLCKSKAPQCCWIREVAILRNHLPSWRACTLWDSPFCRRPMHTLRLFLLKPAF